MLQIFSSYFYGPKTKLRIAAQVRVSSLIMERHLGTCPSPSERATLLTELCKVSSLLDAMYNMRAWEPFSPAVSIDVTELGTMQQKLRASRRWVLERFGVTLVASLGFDRVHGWATFVECAEVETWSINAEADEQAPQSIRTNLFRSRCEIRAWLDELDRPAPQVFISHASADSEEATALDRRIRKRFKTFLAQRDLTAGEEFERTVRRKLLASDAVLVLLTPRSIRSEWVLTEWGTAWAIGTTVIPVILRCDLTDLPFRLRELQCVDYHDTKRIVDAIQKVIAPC
jgi:hypothetical protein